jgi:hypothetical protein
VPTESEIRTTPPTDPEPRRTTRLRSERAELDVTPPRSESRPTVAVEYDFQNLFHPLLPAIFNDGRGMDIADYWAYPGVQVTVHPVFDPDGHTTVTRKTG